MVRDLSLRGTLIRRLLFALIALGVSSAAFTYVLTNRYGNEAYDRALYDSAVSLSQQVSTRGGVVRLDLPPEARAVLLTDQVDNVVYRAINLQSGQVLDQNIDLGPWPESGALNEPRYRDYHSALGWLRVVSLEKALPNGTHVLIEVGETRHKRDSLTREILAGLAVLVLAIVTMTILVVSRGTARALAPLSQLEADAASRSMDNLAPLNPQGAPREVRGLLNAINRLMARLGEAMAHQQRFTANAAHQLRTPLAGLRLQAQLALKGGDVAELRQALMEIEANAGRASHIIDQLLTLARAEVNVGQRDRLRTVDLAQMALEVVSRHVRAALNKHIDLGFEGAHHSPSVMANASLLEELISNLIDNAIRYTQAGGRVTVSVEVRPDTVDLLVTDDGPGIDPSEREHVFQRFYRSDTAVAGGAGLGLAIVREIAERHGAHVSIEDAPEGAGCRFRVCFPRR